MLRIIAGFIVCLFAVYGAVCFGSMLAQMFWKGKKHKKAMAGLILLVKDQEEEIEGIIRSMYHLLYPDKLLPCTKLVVVDMGSGDDTLDLLERLKKQYANIEVLEYNEREQAFTLFSHML